MRKILVALDTSPHAPHVLAEGAALAVAFGAELVFVRVVGIPTEPLPSAALTLDFDRTTDLLRDNATRELDALTKDVSPGVPCVREVRIGIPWLVICEVADERDVDVIVLGAHGHKFLDRVLGSTTSRVVGHTERSTYIARGPRRVRQTDG
jgi:universal stress protein A